MLPADFHFDLPPELIARHPAERRDASRLLHLPRQAGEITHHAFAELPALLRPGDCLVLNDSRVLPARLHVQRPGGGQAELLLSAEQPDGSWEVLARPARKLQPGMRLALPDGLSCAEVLPQPPDAAPDARTRRVRFHLPAGRTLTDFLEQYGEMPLPPYIIQQRRAHGEDSRHDAHLRAEDLHRYQTVYARQTGSVAAPTAGLHFTPELLQALAARGIEVCRVTLHVGLGTFQPLEAGPIETQQLHAEHYEIAEQDAEAIEAARRDPLRRVIAVGTTAVRTLEACFAANGSICPTRASTRIFIYPGRPFHVVQGMVTNFHLPESSLLMLVAAFTSRERILEAYGTAIAAGYRFYSYGDAMLIE
jgi:S-adenosylmethionine:tRNA ribosyltransferase-isomerase